MDEVPLEEREISLQQVYKAGDNYLENHKNDFF